MVISVAGDVDMERTADRGSRLDPHAFHLGLVRHHRVDDLRRDLTRSAYPLPLFLAESAPDHTEGLFSRLGPLSGLGAKRGRQEALMLRQAIADANWDTTAHKVGLDAEVHAFGLDQAA